MLIRRFRWLAPHALGVIATSITVAFLTATFGGAVSAQDKGIARAREKSKDHAYAKGQDKSQDKANGNGSTTPSNGNGLTQDKGIPLAQEKSKDHAYAKGQDKGQENGNGNGRITPSNGVEAPEMDPGSLVGAMSLLSGGALLLASRRKRR